MIQLEAETISAIKEVFSLIGLSDEEINEQTKEFADELVHRYVETMLKKLPEQERKPIAEMAENAKDAQGQQQLKDKLAYWFNEKELQEVVVKVTTDLFGELLNNAYKQATEEQKKQLEAKFKIDEV